MEIDGYRAIIQFDPDIEMFRGEFVDAQPFERAANSQDLLRQTAPGATVRRMPNASRTLITAPSRGSRSPDNDFVQGVIGQAPHTVMGVPFRLRSSR